MPWLHGVSINGDGVARVESYQSTESCSKTVVDRHFPVVNSSVSDQPWSSNEQLKGKRLVENDPSWLA